MNPSTSDGFHIQGTDKVADRNCWAWVNSTAAGSMNAVGTATATGAGFCTADFADTTPGNLRIDYTLLSRRLRPTDAGVFWPVRSDPLSRLTGEYPFPTSDHRLVWADVEVR
mgnify:CR=1 FL=1